MNKIFAVIITYYPNVEELKNNILSFIDGVDKIMIWENTPIKDAIQYRPMNHEKVFYMSEGYNIGIAKPLNKALDYAFATGYDYILTMDQDSCWTDFISYKTLVVNNKFAPKGMFGPIRKLNSPKTQINLNTNNTYIISDVLITSGMLCPIDIMKQLQGWNNNLFVDGVDEDLMIRAKINNINTYFVQGIFFKHKLGYPIYKTFFGKSYTVNNYSAYRLFDRYKSLFILLRKYPLYKYPCIKQIHKRLCYDWLWVNPPRILLGAPNRFKKIWAMLRGSLVGLTCKL